ncbi:MAG TPA: HAD hydrolase-like protein [Candidatus Paceibacterota bacterium]|jgi:phosphoglycolate phosphatase-like HAD superfamily hydrolase|nr:HAD hydrolase-like protein [Candidatus Paceibacterota bacterium]
MSVNKKKLVIFDFDGVLVDTLQLWHSINGVTNPSMTTEDFAKLSYGNFHELSEASSFVPNPNAHNDYHERITDFDVPIEIQEVIQYFHPTHLLAIVSSGPEEAIKRSLKKENLLQYFDDVLGLETHKLKTVKLQILLDKYSLSKNDAVFITDTLGDILESNQVDVPVIGVTWGLHEREILERGNPIEIIDNPAYLQGAIEKALHLL